jgi:hypothetical protein
MARMHTSSAYLVPQIRLGALIPAIESSSMFSKIGPSMAGFTERRDAPGRTQGMQSRIAP